MKLNNNLIKIIALLKGDKRYLVIALVVVFMLFFGPKVDTPPENQCPAANSIMSKSSVGSSNPHYQSLETINTNHGDAYRIYFNLNINDGFDKKNVKKDKDFENDKIKVSLLGRGGETTELKDVLISSEETGPIFYDEIFITDGQYQHILFDFEGSSTRDYEINQLRLTRLSSSDKNVLASLKKTVVGNNKESVMTEMSNASKVIYSFHERNLTIGQIFKATSDTVSSVELKMDFRGGGGSGLYSLQLKSVELIENRFVVSDEVLSVFNFSSISARSENKIDDNIYRFPLSSHLETGKYYFVGLDNSKIRQNLLNHLIIYGNKNQRSYEYGQGIIQNSNGSVKEIGDLYFRINSNEHMKVDNHKMVTNSIVEDIGLGQGYFSYEFQNKFINILDIDSFKLPRPNEQNNSYVHNVYFDQRLNSIMVPAGDGAEVIYKFFTIHPFKVVDVGLSETNNDYLGLEVEYSFDKISWYEIPENEGQNKNENFKQRIQGSGGNELYIKIKPDLDELNYKTNKYFGWSKLKIDATLATLH